MLISFDSDGGVKSDSFEAEYWCVSRESVGCTDSSAINYSPTATVDDGSCRWCSEGVVDLPVDAATSKQLDFSTGSASSAACQWMIQCDEIAVMRLAHVHTQSQNYISVYDGDSKDAQRIAQVSGSRANPDPLPAHEGKMLISFDSGSDVQSDSFEAEYWCVSRESVGCTDSSALNYSPAATVDDGSCLCGDDHCGDTAALLQAFVVDPTAQSVWDALHGWGADSTDLCDWQGVSCTKDRVSGVDLSGKGSLKFEIGDTITKLTKLDTLYVPTSLPYSSIDVPLQRWVYFGGYGGCGWHGQKRGCVAAC